MYVLARNACGYDMGKVSPVAHISILNLWYDIIVFVSLPTLFSKVVPFCYLLLLVI